MFYILLALASFIAVWVGCAAQASRHGLSKTIGIGGGFVAACFVLAVVGWLFMFLNAPPLPKSLAESGLSGKQWSQHDMGLAAKITMSNLRDIQSLVEDADKRGDAAAAVQAVTFLVPIMREWNDQDAEKLGRYRNCLLAASHLADGGISVSKGGRFNANRFDASLSSCNSSIH